MCRALPVSVIAPRFGGAAVHLSGLSHIQKTILHIMQYVSTFQHVTNAETLNHILDLRRPFPVSVREESRGYRQCSAASAGVPLALHFQYIQWVRGVAGQRWSKPALGYIEKANER